MDKTGSV